MLETALVPQQIKINQQTALDFAKLMCI